MQLFVQQTFDQLLDDPLARPLRETTFVVVDLETTGGPPDGCGITEVGAVKICGGAELAEFATLVNPGQPVPPFITVLTGITEAMLLPAPPLAEVFPAFLLLARIGARPAVDRGYLILAVAAQAVMLDHFLHGGWLA